jgi:hypothetical protein
MQGLYAAMQNERGIKPTERPFVVISSGIQGFAKKEAYFCSVIFSADRV